MQKRWKSDIRSEWNIDFTINRIQRSISNLYLLGYWNMKYRIEKH